MPGTRPIDALHLDPLEVGQVLLDRYVLTARLGVGAFSSVFAAHDRRKNRQVALKWLHPEAESQGLWLRHEFALLASVEHPAIVEVYELHEGTPHGSFFSMQLCSGVPFLSASVGQNENFYISVSAEVLSALSHLHSHGIVHCDIKPDNVLVDGDGHVTLVDFGLALEPRRLQQERPRGTMRYVAPEVLRGDGDARLDLFSWGRVLQEALLGRALGEDNETIPTISHHPTVSDGFLRFCERLAQPSLELRFASAPSALAALESLGASSTARVPSLQRLPWPFVGRETELRSAVQLAKRAMSQRRSHLGVVTGAPGIGKTAFLKAAGSAARKELISVVRLNRHDAESRLRPSDRTHASVQAHALSLLAEVEHAPLWIIDDADRLTVAAWDVLMRLCELCEERSFCVLVAWTEGAIAQRLSSLELMMNERSSRIELRTFLRRDLDKLAHKALGEPLPERWLKVLFEAGAGVPLLTRQVFDAWYADGLLKPDALAGDEPVLPPVESHGFLHAHVLQRLSAIDETLWPTIFACAVLGREVTFDRMLRLAFPTSLIESAMTALEQQSLLERLPSGPRFVHDSYIKALRALIPPTKKQALHSRVAPLFTDPEIADFHWLRGVDTNLAEAAALRSAARATQKHDHRRALARLVKGYERSPTSTLAEKAASAAYLHGDHAGAKHWLAQLQQHELNSEQQNSRDLLHARLALAVAQHQRTLELCKQVLRRTTTKPSSPVTAQSKAMSDLEQNTEAIMLMARAELELGHTSEAAELLDNLAQKRGADINLDLERAELALRRGRQDDAAAHLDHIEQGNAANLPADKRAKLYLMRGQWLSEAGQYWLALDYLYEARGIARQLGDRVHEARTQRLLALIRRQQGQIDEARDLNEKARRTFIAHDARGDAADCTFELAKLDLRAARYDSAIERLNEVLSVRRDRHDALGRAHAQATLARVHLELGLPRETLHYGELALRQAQRSNDVALALYAEVLMVSAEEPRPWALFELARRAQALGIARLEVSILWRALLDGTSASELFQRITDLSSALDSKEARVLAMAAKAIQARHNGKLDEAEPLLRAAVTMLGARDHRELTIRLQSELGETLLMQHRQRDALSVLVEAMSELRTIALALPSHKAQLYLEVEWRQQLRRRFQRSAHETG